MYQKVLEFWFEEIPPKNWWIADATFDDLIGKRFSGLLQQAKQAELSAWRRYPKGRLAEIIVLDQFSRNVYRGTPQAFTQDPMALVLAQEAVSLANQQSLSEAECGFLLMPYMHSESPAIHAQAVPLFREYASDSSYQSELRHKEIIDRFGRYPHRNDILGRASTAAEIAFLKLPGSSF